MVSEITRNTVARSPWIRRSGAVRVFKSVFRVSNQVSFQRKNPTRPPPNSDRVKPFLWPKTIVACARLPSACFRNRRLSILLARTGQEAIAIAEQEEGEIVLLVTDFAMPGMLGSDLATQLTNNRPLMKVLCILRLLDDELPIGWPIDWKRLRKPFTRDALLNSVRERLFAIEKKSVLVVDDDPSIRMFIADVLSPDGYSVSRAANGRQALEQLRTQRCHVLITDLIMPEQEGIETIRMARREFPRLRVVAMSGSSGESSLNAAKYLGAEELLSKPFGAESLRLAVKRVLAVSQCVA